MSVPIPVAYALPYLPEIERLAEAIKEATRFASKAIDNYADDPITGYGSVVELVNAAETLLLTARACAMASGCGQRGWVQ